MMTGNLRQSFWVSRRSRTRWQRPTRPGHCHQRRNPKCVELISSINTWTVKTQLRLFWPDRLDNTHFNSKHIPTPLLPQLMNQCCHLRKAPDRQAPGFHVQSPSQRSTADWLSSVKRNHIKAHALMQQRLPDCFWALIASVSASRPSWQNECQAHIALALELQLRMKPTLTRDSIQSKACWVYITGKLSEQLTPPRPPPSARPQWHQMRHCVVPERCAKNTS